MTYKDFIEKAILKHGEKYSYPAFEFKNSKEKITIICPEHGEFKQNLYAHLKGQGCPLCSCKRHGYNTEKFIAEAKEKFGDKFDYSKTEYVNKRTKVCITCKDIISEDNPNGEFWQLPFHHLNSVTGMPSNRVSGREYPKLTDEDKIKSATNKFIIKAKNIFHNKIDFSKTIYTGSMQKSIFICPEHGEFSAVPGSILSGHGCPKCGKTGKLSVDEFKEKAMKIHGDKFDYRKVNFNNSNDNVVIICPEHGDFSQNVTHHLQGHGCPKCAKNKPLTTEEFIVRSKKVHDDKYDYSKTEYRRTNDKVCIICPEHGEFWQTPNSHLNGQGCPLCHESKLEKNIEQMLTMHNIKFERQKRINSIKNERVLPFDYYLPVYNILIECQGKQHFSEITFFKGKLEERIRLDILKYDGAIKHGFRILYYTDIKNVRNLIVKNEKLKQLYDVNLYTSQKELLKQIKETV